MSPSTLPRHLVYGVLERFITEDGRADRHWTANRLAEWLTEEGYPTNREQIFPIFRFAVDRGYLKLCPPIHDDLRRQLSQRYPQIPGDTWIYDLQQPTITQNLAQKAAELVVDLMKTIDDQRRAKSPDGPRQPIHVGLGAGATTRRVVYHLAQKLAFTAGLPPLVFHAISSGFSPKHCMEAPVAYFSYFSELSHPIEYVGLFSAPVVPAETYEETLKLPFILEAIEEAKKIDIVVTSLAQADDEHGLLNMFNQANGRTDRVLERAGHVGDLQFRPFSKGGPIELTTGIRAVTTFELEDLVRLARTPGKHVILVAGTCNRCGRRKADALRPILEVPSLNVCNHLLTDVETARQLLD